MNETEKNLSIAEEWDSLSSRFDPKAANIDPDVEPEDWFFFYAILVHPCLSMPLTQNIYC